VCSISEAVIGLVSVSHGCFGIGDEVLVEGSVGRFGSLAGAFY